jgi:hypothetical protein
MADVTIKEIKGILSCEKLRIVKKQQEEKQEKEAS